VLPFEQQTAVGKTHAEMSELLMAKHESEADDCLFALEFVYQSFVSH